MSNLLQCWNLFKTFIIYGEGKFAQLFSSTEDKKSPKIRSAEGHSTQSQINWISFHRSKFPARNSSTLCEKRQSYSSSRIGLQSISPRTPFNQLRKSQNFLFSFRAKNPSIFSLVSSEMLSEKIIRQTTKLCNWKCCRKGKQQKIEELCRRKDAPRLAVGSNVFRAKIFPFRVKDCTFP